MKQSVELFCTPSSIRSRKKSVVGRRYHPNHICKDSLILQNIHDKRTNHIGLCSTTFFEDTFDVDFSDSKNVLEQSPFPVSTSWLSDSAASISTTTEFAPQTDWNALLTFVSIMLVSVLLVQRTNAVEQAVIQRDEALQVVRDLKSKELSGSLPSDDETMTDALQKYETAVQTEEQLRNIVPGVVRIVPPSSGSQKEETARDAAKQFLGQDYDIGVDKRPVVNADGQLPIIALGILGLLGISLTGLLVFLSMDPNTVSNILKAL